ncbi:hypothetical protein GX51_01977 [Blastomyces parvus]|uniref:Uncharacterized protein n=1 Tax=Blastomyces parvus TaxID=2060905 RepID=A0A2B7XE51_9EURO|nr:hypothetical protein GX51_01977 [Blastomyces parvus]
MEGGNFPLNDHDKIGLCSLPERLNSFHPGGLPALGQDQYTIAWICGLYIEMAAARAILDQIHEPLPTHVDDTNTYVLGNIKHHHVVIACLPAEQYGINNAANVLTNMRRTFSAIRIGFMVGIGGCVPSKANDMRLGDVVVGTRVMQYDLGKIVGDGQLQRTAIPRIPHPLLGTAVSALRAKHELSLSRVASVLQQHFNGHSAYGRPNLPDRLFRATYEHASLTGSCDGCDHSQLVSRIRRMPDDIKIHYGAIASGNQVMRYAATRDNIARQLDVICFEMEAAGLMDVLPCLPIRGICDYSDSHKNKEWQKYAAATAAAYTREFLEELPMTEAHVRAASMPNSLTDQSSSHERRQKLLNSLRFAQIDSRKSTIKTAHNKTCRWFLSRPDYEAWLDPAKLTQHYGFLWISGKPGAGKSTIMKFAYSEMKRKARRQDAIIVSFFFNARGEHLEKSILGMYRSLLLQLLEGHPDLQTILDDPELIPQSQNGWPSLDILKELFGNAVFALGKRSVTCFVDALDECDEQHVVEMVEFFEDLAEQSTANGVQFRICFSSRHYPYIDIQRAIRLTLEDQSGHAEDLTNYVSSRLRIDNHVLVEELRPEILGKAAGVFMWVILVVHILNKEYRRGGLALRMRLAETPSDLSELFRDILRRDNENIEHLLFCILWILYAKRPLRPAEFNHALWSGLSLNSLADDQFPDLNIIERRVVNYSKGLAEITKSQHPTVQFIHESVRDFLIKDKGLHDLWPGLGSDCESPSHEKLKQFCSFYMNHTVLRGSVSRVLSESQPGGKEKILNEFPFLRYASQNILYHANATAKSVPQNDFLSTFPISRWIKISNLFERFKVHHYSPDARLFYILAEKGYNELVRTRLKVEPQSRVFGEIDENPLFVALANGNKDTIAAL